jgi:hypothetical protein
VKFSENYNFFLPQRGDNDPADPNIYSSNFEIIDRILGNLHPVGDIVLRMDETNPGTLYGGVWEKIQDAFLIGAGGKYDLGSSGGEATHQLEQSELPYFTEPVRVAYQTEKNFASTSDTEAGSDSMLMFDASWKTTQQNPAITATNRMYVEISGGNQPHNNMPPYVAVNIWERIA